jgi:hypothetical protein
VGKIKYPGAPDYNMDNQALPRLPPQAADRRITLQVGERQFVTAREALVAESGFFASLLSGRWDNAQEDGSFFIDADANLFEHVLRYLRRGVPPIFYDMAKGHDQALYLALLGEARYFQIPRLQKWLEDKRYFDAVKVKRVAEEVEDISLLSATLPTYVADVEYYPSWGARKVYVCPRGIYVHRAKPEACGKACKRAQGDADDLYDEEPTSRTLMIKKEVIFDTQACMEDPIDQPLEPDS